MHLFFVRAFNDIDHLTPVVSKLHRGGHRVSVYCLHPEYDLESDYRLRYLVEIGVPVGYVHDALFDHRGPWPRFVRWLTVACFRLARRLGRTPPGPGAGAVRTLGRKLRRVGKKLFRHLAKAYYDLPWAERLLRRERPESLCFDWVRPKNYVVDTLLTAAAELAVPTFALPHGVFIYVNDDITTEPMEEGRIFDKYNHYDHVVVQNRLFKEYMTRHGVEGAKIAVLGSARYCDEWMAKNVQLIPRSSLSAATSPDTLKVVFMTTRFPYRIDVEELFRATQALATLGAEGIEVVIKPHTRVGTEGQRYEGCGLPISDRASSVELCEWADVVLVIASSIMIEATVRQKPVLYLKYLHGNTTLYEKYGACWQIESSAELVAALRTLKADRGRLPYTDEAVHRFVTDVIHGGVEGRDVLGDYERFIVTHSASAGVVPSLLADRPTSRCAER